MEREKCPPKSVEGYGGWVQLICNEKIFTQICRCYGDGMQGERDMVICLLNALGELTTLEEAVQCFRSVHRCLRAGGLFVLESMHPADIFDGSLEAGASPFSGPIFSPKTKLYRKSGVKKHLSHLVFWKKESCQGRIS